MAGYTCWKCGSRYSGTYCSVCTINEQTEKAANQASRDQERATAAMEAAVSEQTERFAEEMERSREAAEEAAFETQMAIAEAADQQRRALAESAAEHRRIAANTWRLQAQAKSDQAYQLYRGGLVREALQLALHAIKEDPGNMDAVFVAGACYKSEGQVEEATTYYVKQVQMLDMAEYRGQLKFHLQVFQAIRSDPVLSKVCCRTMQEHLSGWSHVSLASSDQLVRELLERGEYALAVLVQHWALRSKGVILEALVSTRKAFRFLAGSLEGLDSARPGLEKIIEWLESPGNTLSADRADARTARISLLAVAFALEFASMISRKTSALEFYFGSLLLEGRVHFEGELTNLQRMVVDGDIDSEAFSRIMDRAKRTYSLWEPELRSQLSNSVTLQVENSPKPNLGCLAGGIWFIVLFVIGVLSVVSFGRGYSVIPSFLPILFGSIVLGKLSANTVRSFRKQKLARELLSTGLDDQNKTFASLSLPQIAAPKVIISSPKVDLAICAGVAFAILVGWVFLIVKATRPSSMSSITNQPYDRSGNIDNSPRPAGHKEVDPGMNKTSRQIVPSVPQDFSAEINAAIINWRDALLSNDPDRIADCYASSIDRYFLQTNVTHEYVKQYILKLHDNGDLLTGEDLSQISIQRTSESTAEAQFIESFGSFTGGKDKKGTVRTILHFTKEGGAWKISFQRQLHLSSQ